MMVNVDQETLFEPVEQRAPHAVAFEQYDGVVRRHSVRLNCAVSERQVLIDARYAVVHDDFRILAHGAQDLTAGKGRPDAVSIGPRVRSHHKTAARPNLL